MTGRTNDGFEVVDLDEASAQSQTTTYFSREATITEPTVSALNKRPKLFVEWQEPLPGFELIEWRFSPKLNMAYGEERTLTFHATATPSDNTLYCNVAEVESRLEPPPSAGVTIKPSAGTTNVTEGGVTDTYDVTLNAQPSASTTVTITSDSQLSVSTTTLTFTTANWDTPQTVTVTAVNDSVVEGAHTGTITHSASGGGYDSVSVPSLVVNVTDNDPANVIITESGGSTDVTEGGDHRHLQRRVGGGGSPRATSPSPSSLTVSSASAPQR